MRRNGWMLSSAATRPLLLSTRRRFSPATVAFVSEILILSRCFRGDSFANPLSDTAVVEMSSSINPDSFEGFYPLVADRCGGEIKL